MSLDSLCRWQVQVSVYCARRIPAHPVFNHVAPYRYLPPTVYLFMADISNPDLFVCSCRTLICLDITRVYEEQDKPSSGSAWPACAGGFDTICTAVCNRSDSSTTCRLCRLEPLTLLSIHSSLRTVDITHLKNNSLYTYTKMYSSIS